ncbi:LPD7 domain-containing protein [Sphingomonas mollis]|uniref:Large polyvalent protein-associated domain-containing protein n=1 Tax=Sphingomonas mollis TaxID=2795726 RepID=A0ABS0XU86_9SPHN|nr:LPD7 domain-containing protein [Sphingomonas sp. BT553]MBJ6123610.1 hypothetical protein [Sphingomonas sp. BT553]
MSTDPNTSASDHPSGRDTDKVTESGSITPPTSPKPRVDAAELPELAEAASRSRATAPRASADSKLPDEGAPAQPADGKARRTSTIDESDSLPAHIRSRYVKVGDEYFRNSSEKNPTFKDGGARLVGRDASVAGELVEIAEHRQWDRLRVSGSEAFRREVWKAAMARGIEVEGYSPTKVELEEARRRGEGSITHIDRSRGPSQREERSGIALPARPDFDRGVEGRILEIGTAKFNERAKRDTPFVDLETPDGRRERAWGVGLSAALERSGSRVGDHVAVRRAGTDPVEVDSERGRIPADRNRWDIKGLDGRDQTGSAAASERFMRQSHAENARDPDLKAAQGHVMLAHVAARARFGEDRDAVDRATTAAKIEIAGRLSRGEKTEPVQVKERVTVQTEQSREILFHNRERSR